jgi:hypothetical protein
MKKILSLSILSALLATGCASGDADSMVRQSIEALDETAQAMAAVKDEPSARAAVPRLQALAQRRKKIEEKTATLKTPSPVEQAELQKKYAARLTGATTRLMTEALRVSMVPGGDLALDAMDGK